MDKAPTSPFPEGKPRWISPSAEAEFNALQDGVRSVYEEAAARIGALPIRTIAAMSEIAEDAGRRTEGARNQMASLYGGFTLPAPILVRRPAP